MEIRRNKIKYTEIGLIAFVWLVLLLTPILFREDYNNPLKKSIFNQLEIVTPLIILFVINRFILVPKLLFEGKQSLFIVIVLGTIILLTVGSYLYDTRIKHFPPVTEFREDNQTKPPPKPLPGEDDQFENPRPPEKPQPRPIPPYANFLILSVLVVGFDTGLRSGLRWMEVENEKVRLEKENVDAQLVLLRNQVSPHFFMNTLNNIHSLVDTDAGEAKESIIKLSKMMRYLLYETGTEKTTLKKEIEFLESYINLMKLRISEKVRVTLSLPTNIPDKKIPPFLFISLIENAFKHGISYKKDSFINIDLTIGEERFLLVVKNSKTDKKSDKEYSGIGIENTRKRLELLYGNNYHLDIIDNEDLYTVNLSIPL